MENLITSPMETFCRRDLEEARDKRKKFDKSRSSYDGALSKASQVKKNQNTLKVLELEHELADAKQDFYVTSLEYVMTLNDTQSRKKLEVLEKVCSSIFSQLSYYHQAYEMLHEMEPSLKSLSAHFGHVRKTFDSDKIRSEIRGKELEKVLVGLVCR
jgi:hypothetical protein